MIINYLKNDITIFGFVIAGVLIRYLPQVYYDIVNRKGKILFRKTSIAKARYIFFLYVFIFVGFFVRSGYYPDSIFLLTLGILSFAFGVALGLVGLFSLNNQYSEELIRYEGGFLVTNGVYRIVRHPMRTGLFTELLGMVILANISLLWLPLIGVFVLQYMRTKDEESMLKEFFGTELNEYISNVPKFNFANGLYRALRNRRHHSPQLYQTSSPQLPIN